MRKGHVRLRYSFEGGAAQAGADIEHPLFDLLAALQAHGSIQAAARAQQRSYRAVWGQLKQAEASLGAPLVDWVQGRPATLTAYALRLLWAERQARVRMTPHIEALRAELRQVLAIAEDADALRLEVVASHDQALPRLQDLTAGSDGLHLGLTFTGSQDALRALRGGHCDVAGFHVPRFVDNPPLFMRALRPLLSPGQHKLIGSHRREQGLMHRPDGPSATSFAEVAERGLRFVNRQVGSGTRLIVDHLLQTSDIDARDVDGYETRVERTHVAVAAVIAAGEADVGVGVRAAAQSMGLSFVPLVEEDYYLVCLKEALTGPAVERLRRTLASSAWREALQSLPGYTPNCSGEVLSLTRALPWWWPLKARSKPRPPRLAA